MELWLPIGAVFASVVGLGSLASLTARFQVRIDDAFPLPAPTP